MELIFGSFFVILIAAIGVTICGLLFRGLVFLATPYNEGDPSEPVRPVGKNACIVCIACIVVAIAVVLFSGFRKSRLEDQLISAATVGDTKTVERILNTGINVDATGSDDRRFTPLMSAACQGHTETVRALLRHHPYVNFTGGNGYTALSLARDNNHPDTARVLEDAGAQ